VDFDHLLDLHRRSPTGYPPTWGAMPGVNEKWVELTVPRVVSGTIRFLARDIAIVDGASAVAGVVTLAPRVPLLFVVKREGTAWRIVTLRVVLAHGEVQCSADIACSLRLPLETLPAACP
jgi:hypothetical protein